MHTTFVANKLPGPKDSTNRLKIRNVFRQFYGSGTWAARLLGVKKPTISQWLHGKKSSGYLDSEMPKLAQRLQDSAGACIHDVSGPSVRSRIARLRRTKEGR
jgi:hypothetical protein